MNFVLKQRRHIVAGRMAGCCAAGTAAPRQARSKHWARCVQTGSTADWPEVPQTGPKADQVKQNLTKIKLPPGFHISLYALVPDARHIAVGPQGVATFVGTRKSKVWVVTDRSRGGVGDEVKEFAPTLPKKIPNGPCFSKDGFLYIVEQNRVLEYPAAEFFYESPDVVAGVVVPEGELIPKAEESYNHTAASCRVGPDNKLYIQLGQPYNVPAEGKARHVPQARHRRDHPHGPRRQEPRSLRDRAAQSRRHGFQPKGQVALDQRQPGRRHGRRPAARRE